MMSQRFKLQPIAVLFSYHIMNCAKIFVLISLLKQRWCKRIISCSFHFSFLVTFGDEVMKIQKSYITILQGKLGKTKKNGKKITQLKWPKFKRPKEENMRWTKNKTANNLSYSFSNFKLLWSRKCKRMKNLPSEWMSTHVF